MQLHEHRKCLNPQGNTHLILRSASLAALGKHCTVAVEFLWRRGEQRLELVNNWIRLNYELSCQNIKSPFDRLIFSMNEVMLRGRGRVRLKR